MRKINFKRVSAIAASALMVGMTMGTAVAANYPQPFVVSGAADAAIVYGTGSGVSSLDVVQAGNIQANLQSYMSGSSGSTTVTGGDFWQVGTASDQLEINETIQQVTSYIGVDDLALLADGSISNEKGEAKYKQYLYFEPTDSSNVVYTSDPDTDALGLYYKVNSGKMIARYVMDFTTSLKSDIDTADNKLSDIADEMITFLGKTYTITGATMGTGGVELTLMSGTSSGTVTEGTSVTVGDYTVSVIVSSSTAAQFTVTSTSGTDTTNKLKEGDIEKLSDGNYIAVTDITYEGYAEGDQSATFYIGADKIEWKNNSAMIVNGETISDAKIAITSTNVSDVTITQIAVNMTAEDDLYVATGKKLSEASDLDEPQVLVSQNWDIEFAGLKAVDYETIKLDATGSDKKYVLEFMNYEGDVVKLPLLWINATGVFGGETEDRSLVLDTGFQNVTKNDYVILNTASPIAATNNAKTVVVQYDGADKTGDNSPQFHFTLNPGANEETKDVPMSATGTGTLQAAGASFTFINASDCTTLSDCKIAFTAGDYGNGASNVSASNYIRTYYNTFINITDTLAGFVGEAQDATVVTNQSNFPWTVTAIIDDATRDDDSFTLPVNGALFNASIGNTTTDAANTLTGTGKWESDPDNSDVSRYIGLYGQEIQSTDPSDSPPSVEVKVPKSIVNPLVYVTTKEGVSVSTTTGGSTQLGDILAKDSEVSSVSSKNLIVVGGSCINSVAANLLGATCGSDFTDKTGVGTGQFLIQSLASTYSTGKIALVIAGYEAADTVNAATYLRTQTVDTTAGKKYKGTSSTTAELQVA